MTQAQHVPNHTVDVETGFLESNGSLQAFDAERKKIFLSLYQQSGLRLHRTCAELSLKAETVHKHYELDPAFRKAFDLAKTEYYDELQGVSRVNALNPKSVIERIFQLKAGLPEIYGEGKRDSGMQVNITIDSKLLASVKERDRIIEAEIIPSTQPDSSKTVDNQ